MEKEISLGRKVFKILRWILFILISLFIVTFIILEGLIYYHGHKKPEKEADILIILGARLYGEKPSPALMRRIDAGYTYLTQFEDSLVIVSGGTGDGAPISEALAMKRELMNRGIDEARILLEDQSTNTYENITFSQKILEMNQAKLPKDEITFGVVTNSFHVFRGKLIAMQAGLDAVGIPAKTPPTTRLKGYVREYFGILKYFLVDKPY
ncbi:MAG: YdcF family protein [Clostridium sp.]|nr:YdcF family protein [Clostridium sp.]